MRTQRTRNTKLRRSVVVGFLLTVGLAATVMAKVYVSLNGGFSIDYPEEWWQVDYQTVDYYLQQMQADPETYNYDAVFSARKIAPFHEYEYLILTIDTTGEMSRRERDSVVEDLGELFGEKIEYRPIQESFAALEMDHPAYDRDQQLFIRLTEAGDDDQGFKMHLYALRFYNRGMAHFYFFAPDSTFDEYRPEFYNILMSFSTDSIDAKMPREQVKLANPDQVAAKPEGARTSRFLFGIPIGAVVVIIIVIASRRKRRSRRENM